MKLQEHLLAYAMAAVLLLLMWLIAAWVEVQSHTPKLRTLALTESFETADIRPSNAVQNRLKKPPMIQRRVPRIPESLQTGSTVLPPAQKTLPNTTHLKQAPIELHTAPRSFEAVSAAVVAKSDNLISRVSPQKSQPDVRRDLHRNTMEVTERQDAPRLSLEIQDHVPESRVLETEEAKKIIQWMRITESDLPPGIRYHVGYQPGNLSSSAHLEYQGEVWEIYLMARMPSEELHVVIVRGDATYYVVDPSFQRDGRRFRVGTAHRSGGEITGVTSEERAASSTDAVLHYDVFLAWWDQLGLTLP